MKQDIISYMLNVEDTRTKSMFIMHFGRHNNWIGIFFYISLLMKYDILLWKSGHVLLPLWKLFFNILSQQQHINKQIRYSV